MRTGAGIAGLAGRRPTHTKANGPSLPQLLSLSPLTRPRLLGPPRPLAASPPHCPPPRRKTACCHLRTQRPASSPRAHRGSLLSAPAAFHPRACGEGRDLGESQGRVRGQGGPGGVNTR